MARPRARQPVSTSTGTVTACFGTAACISSSANTTASTSIRFRSPSSNPPPRRTHSLSASRSSPDHTLPSRTPEIAMSATEPHEHAPFIDYENLPAPTTGILVTQFITVRSVADIQACYQQWSAKGAEFVTPPIDRGAEIRCYMRDPDGYMIEVGQATGALHGQLAKKRPEDLPG